MKTIVKTILLAAAAAAGFSSCDSLTKYGLNPFEATTPVAAKVISAGSVKFDSGLNMNKKSKKWSTVESLTEGYSQSVKIQTADGRIFTHSHQVSSDDDVLSVGSTGTANIGVTSGTLWSFKAE